MSAIERKARVLKTGSIYKLISDGNFDLADKMIREDLNNPKSDATIIDVRIKQSADLYKKSGRSRETLRLLEKMANKACDGEREILLMQIAELADRLKNKQGALELAIEVYGQASGEKIKEVAKRQIGRFARKKRDDKTVATLGLGAEEFEKLFAEQPTGSDDPVLDLFIRYNNGENMMDELNALLGKQDKKNRNPDVRLQILAAYIKSSGGSSIRREIATIRGKVSSEVIADLRRPNTLVAAIKKKETVGEYLGL